MKDTERPVTRWLVNGANEICSKDIPKSNLASVRLRAGALAVAVDAKHVTFGEAVPEYCEALIIGKIGFNGLADRSERWLTSIDYVRRSGGRIICDYTDNHLGFESPLGNFYREALALTDFLVVPSRSMEHLARSNYSGPIEVIPDAVEVPITSPRNNFDHRVRRLFWFGHGSNLNYLLSWLAGFEIPRNVGWSLHLHILTSLEGISWLRETGVRSRSTISITAGIWSIEAMINCAAKADICIIPSDPTDPRKRGVSSNRFLTALSLGLPVAADPIESYLEFSDYFVDLSSHEFRALLDAPLSAHEKIRQAQERLIPKFTMSSVGDLWVRWLRDLRSQDV